MLDIALPELIRWPSRDARLPAKGEDEREVFMDTKPNEGPGPMVGSGAWDTSTTSYHMKCFEMPSGAGCSDPVLESLQKGQVTRGEKREAKVVSLGLYGCYVACGGDLPTLAFAGEPCCEHSLAATCQLKKVVRI